MIVVFTINYRAAWGENIWLNISEQGGEPRLHKMVCTDGERWALELDIPPTTTEIEYMYELRRDEHLVSRGWGKRRLLQLDSRFKKYTLRDTWQVIPANKTLFSSPFTQVFFKREDAVPARNKFRQAITVKVYAPAVKPNQELRIAGSSEALGRWDIAKAPVMNGASFPEFTIVLDAEQAMTTGDEYKFVVTEGGFAVEWEQGENRVWARSAFDPCENRVYSGLNFRGGNVQWHGAGVAIPVFSLRSTTSNGIGDFEDLRKFADWASLTGQRVIQILPINDTTQTQTWRDSYPYKAISIFALHPLYLSLEKMGELKDEKLALQVKSESRRLNDMEQVDYEGVGRMKWSFFKAIYKQEGKKTLQSKEYRDFYNDNKDWLSDYAAFCYLRDVNESADFSKWGKDKKYSKKRVSELTNLSFEEYDKVAIYLYLQFHLDKQLKEAAAYCHSKGVVLKGDIPIGISRDSVEAWSEPHLFNLDCQAGAPPDDFSVLGQNWGFPTYNWEAMAKDGYAWWRRRFEKMADYFDLYRIDHILGFFRIWEIPMDSVQGLLGYFNPAMPMGYDELSAWGMPMNRDRYLKPFIHHNFLGDFFGEYTEEALKFLEAKEWGIYQLKDKFNTQRKVQKYFEDKDDAKSNALRSGLYGLINEVIFIEDPRHPGTFHPRIAAHFTKSYQWLTEYEKGCFNDIYTHFFYHRHNDFWGALAMEKLPPLIDATDMLCCAEDLGMIPDCVHKVLGDLGIITLEIQRMPKDPRATFGNTSWYPYLSVCTTSTHDMSPIRGWWQEDSGKTQRYYNDVMWWYGAAPEVASGQVCQTIVGNHLLAPSILTILPLQDWLSIDERLRLANPYAERINIPADPDHYWRYRMHLTIEELLTTEEFNNLVRDMSEGSGR
ncbi:4-alpha-glucanotransferase (amylomaltase) [Mucinivorans hirudinis]|uniref:4-alpha-glucanotransferase n=1 Tax=Mucinivorans hirudinis TaxID=1433126 RepID=A0A060RBV4_9BACT|nr:4-alpha-glucanotransferase (amylomaltase) [Mucinivorans hirudinis]